MGEQRWEDLFADLDAQMAMQNRLEADAQTADRTRREQALVGWVDRVIGHRTQPLRLILDGGVIIEGAVRDVGADWLLVRPQSGGEDLVRTAAVLSITGLGRRVGSDVTSRRFGLGSVLRELARDRAPVEVLDRRGGRSAGTIDVVHADALELARHDLTEARRAENVLGRVIIPFDAVSVVRRR